MNTLTLLLINGNLIVGFLVIVGLADRFGLIRDYHFEKGLKGLKELEDFK